MGRFLASNMATNILYVDNASYLGNYTEDGSIFKPYKTLAAAEAASSDGDKIIVSSGTYSGDVTFTKKVTLEGNSKDSFVGTIFSGNIVFS